MFKHRCTNGGNQHKFKPRYSILHGDIKLGEFKGSLDAFQSAMEKMADRVYEGDVCSWCGKIINKSNTRHGEDANPQ
jgi:hypothetical protein